MGDGASFFVESFPVYVSLVNEAGIDVDFAGLFGAGGGNIISETDAVAEFPDVEGFLTIAQFEQELIAWNRNLGFLVGGFPGGLFETFADVIHDANECRLHQQLCLLPC